MMAENTANSEITFEEALDELTQIVKSLEGGDLPLDRSLDAFERGVGLLKLCEKKLDAAENRVRLLVSSGEEYEEKPFGGAD